MSGWGSQPWGEFSWGWDAATPVFVTYKAPKTSFVYGAPETAVLHGSPVTAFRYQAPRTAVVFHD